MNTCPVLGRKRPGIQEALTQVCWYRRCPEPSLADSHPKWSCVSSDLLLCVLGQLPQKPNLNRDSFFFEFCFIYFLYSRFSLVTYCIHMSVYMSIPISQFITPPPPPLPLSPLDVRKFVLYTCGQRFLSKGFIKGGTLRKTWKKMREAELGQERDRCDCRDSGPPDPWGSLDVNVPPERMGSLLCSSYQSVAACSLPQGTVDPPGHRQARWRLSRQGKGQGVMRHQQLWDNGIIPGKGSGWGPPTSTTPALLCNLSTVIN